MKHEIEIDISGTKEKFQILTLPQNFLEWQSVTRQEMFKKLQSHGPVIAIIYASTFRATCYS